VSLPSDLQTLPCSIFLVIDRNRFFWPKPILAWIRDRTHMYNIYNFTETETETDTKTMSNLLSNNLKILLLKRNTSMSLILRKTNKGNQKQLLISSAYKVKFFDQLIQTSIFSYLIVIANKAKWWNILTIISQNHRFSV